MKRMVILIAALLLPGMAHAQESNWFSTQDLLRECTAGDPGGMAMCLSYVSGVKDYMGGLGNTEQRMDEKTRREAVRALPYVAICKPPGGDVSGAAAVQAFVNWARANPGDWSYPAIGAVSAALVGIWPCPWAPRSKL